ncbi:MAG: hypothetical protein HUU38_18370 [Anaerolineales bacterium]|nr:hypothetical protein [Anaerolineales bacterium]
MLTFSKPTFTLALIPLFLATLACSTVAVAPPAVQATATNLPVQTTLPPTNTPIPTLTQTPTKVPTETPAPTPTSSFPTGMIFFSDSYAVPQDIHKIDVQAGMFFNLSQQHHGEGDLCCSSDFGLTISPDGTQLAFFHSDEYDPQGSYLSEPRILIMDINDGTVIDTGISGWDYRLISWTSDGTQLLFFNSQMGQLWTINSDGSNSSLRSSNHLNPANVHDYRYFPLVVSDTIYYAFPCDPQTCIFNEHGELLYEIPQGEIAKADITILETDHSQIYYVKRIAGATPSCDGYICNSEVYLFDGNSGTTTLLFTLDSVFNWYWDTLAWSPDQTQLAWIDAEGFVHLTRLDGTEQNVFPIASQNILWSPDQKWICLTSKNSNFDGGLSFGKGTLYIVSVETGEIATTFEIYDTVSLTNGVIWWQP